MADPTDPLRHPCELVATPHDCPTCVEDHEPEACPVNLAVGDTVWLLDCNDSDEPGEEMRVLRLPSGARGFAFRPVGGFDDVTDVPERLFHAGVVVAYVRCRFCRHTLVPIATNRPLGGRVCAECEEDAQASFHQALGDMYDNLAAGGGRRADW